MIGFCLSSKSKFQANGLFSYAARLSQVILACSIAFIAQDAFSNSVLSRLDPVTKFSGLLAVKGVPVVNLADKIAIRNAKWAVGDPGYWDRNRVSYFFAPLLIGEYARWRALATMKSQKLVNFFGQHGKPGPDKNSRDYGIKGRGLANILNLNIRYYGANTTTGNLRRGPESAHLTQGRVR